MDMIQGTLEIVIGVTLVTGVVIVTLKGTNTSTWETSEVAIFGVTSLVAIVGLVYLVKSRLMG